MNGGLLKSASAVAMLAAAGLFANANAADFGGDCCADLEERVAELEATTVRKGNRKVSLRISGHIGHQIMWWDDGSQSDTYIGDGGNIFSRFRFTGDAKITPQITAGFTYEFGVNQNAIGSMNQLNGGDDLGGASAPLLRDTTVWLRHKQLGMVKIGHGSTATDNLILIDLGQKSSAATPDAALYNGGFLLRSGNGLLANNTNANWGAAIRGHESFDTTRRNHVLYETPTLVGFTLQAAVAEDNYWDVALRYAGEFGGFRLAAGIGYQEDTEFNAPSQDGTGTLGVLCRDKSTTTPADNAGAYGTTNVVSNGNCDVKSSDIKGSASILHVPTGLFVTGAGGIRKLDGENSPGNALTSYDGPDLGWWYVSGGISQNFFGVGKTVLFGEYLESKGGLEQAAFLGNTTNTSVTGGVTNSTGYVSNTLATGSSSSTVNMWGVGITQHIDAAAMELFATYKNFSLDASGFTGTNASLNNGANGVADFQTVIVGTRINF
ncbi:MAG: porin [Hyphomicrobiaceae bacterium]